MPRIARVVAKDFPHHVTQRGARNQRVFFSDHDKLRYKDILLEELQKTKLEIWAYCLMDNHVHFVAVPRHEDELSRVFRETHKRYAWTVNKRKRWRGHLWQERFHSFAMEEIYLQSAVRYVENNPVKAKMTDKAEAYVWSSAHSRVYSKDDPILTRCHLDDEIKDWRAFLSGGTLEDSAAIEKHMNGNPLGSQKFISKLESLGHKDITKRPRGRPRTKK
jgi:putative transposase